MYKKLRAERPREEEIKMDNNREKDFVSFYLGTNLLHDELEQSCNPNEAYEQSIEFVQ